MGSRGSSKRNLVVSRHAAVGGQGIAEYGAGFKSGCGGSPLFESWLTMRLGEARAYIAKKASTQSLDRRSASLRLVVWAVGSAVGGQPRLSARRRCGEGARVGRLRIGKLIPRPDPGRLLARGTAVRRQRLSFGASAAGDNQQAQADGSHRRLDHNPSPQVRPGDSAGFQGWAGYVGDRLKRAMRHWASPPFRILKSS